DAERKTSASPGPLSQEQTAVAAPGADDLPTIAGIDSKDGLARVGGNRKLYVKLLRQFVEQQGPALGQIASALSAGDAVLAERIAHTLKGVAGNIGAMSIHSAAGVLEQLIRDRADAAAVDSARQQVADVIDPVLAQLQTVLASGAQETPVQPAPARPANVAQ